MANDDYLKPNGTCYSINNVKAASNFMPCGNVNLLGTHFACCNFGDKCLSSNACYHIKTGTTYIAGCTDKTYSHPSCPQKLYFPDQPWLGLVRCGKSNDLNKKEEEWAGCEEPDDLSLDEAPANCDCDGKQALFRDAPILEDIAQLPSKTSDTISYYAGHTPTIMGEPGSSATAEADPSDTAASSTPTDDSTTSVPSTDTPSATPDAGLTVGAKAGIGIGAAVGALLIGCMVFMALLLRKRKKKQRAQALQDGSPNTGHGGGHGQSMHAYTEVPFASPAMSGFKSELAADTPGLKFEMSAEEPNSARWTHNGSVSPGSPPPHELYEPYDPHNGHHGRHSAISNASTATANRYGSVPNSPQHPEWGQQPSPLPPVSELQG